MAKDEKKPTPTHYNKLHDMSMDKILAEYQSFHTEDAEALDEQDTGHIRDKLYTGIVKHLEQHGKDPKTGKLKHYGYAKFDDKKKWTEDLLRKVLTPAIVDHYGADAAAAYAKNEEMFRQYVEQNMGNGKMGYDQIVEFLSDQSNLKDGFYNNEQVKQLFDNYLSNTSARGRRIHSYGQHIAHHAKYDDVLKFADKSISAHKFKHKTGVGIDKLLESIALSKNPNFRPKKNRVYEPLPEKKK